MSLDFSKDFFLYIIIVDTSYAAVLAQKNQDENELPISFMSVELEEAQLKYLEVDQHGFTVFKEVKHFSPYLLKSQIKVIVPYLAIKNLFIQKELREIHAH